MSTQVVESQRQLTKLQQLILEYIYSRQASYIRPVSSAVLSRALHISWTHAREQAHQLVKMGLLEVRSGPGGGYFPSSPGQAAGLPWHDAAGGTAGAGKPELHGLISELQATAAELAALAQALRARAPSGGGGHAAPREGSDPQADRLVGMLQRLRQSARQAREATLWGGARGGLA